MTGPIPGSSVLSRYASDPNPSKFGLAEKLSQKSKPEERAQPIELPANYLVFLQAEDQSDSEDNLEELSLLGACQNNESERLKQILSDLEKNHAFLTSNTIQKIFKKIIQCDAIECFQTLLDFYPGFSLDLLFIWMINTGPEPSKILQIFCLGENFSKLTPNSIAWAVQTAGDRNNLFLFSLLINSIRSEEAQKSLGNALFMAVQAGHVEIAEMILKYPITQGELEMVLPLALGADDRIMAEKLLTHPNSALINRANFSPLAKSLEMSSLLSEPLPALMKV